MSVIEQNQGDCKGLQNLARGALVVIAALVVAFLVGIFWAGRASAETGGASYYNYGPVACPGRHVGPMTAAHKSLPCGTRVRVTTRSGSAVLTITDRGPYVRGRIIDVSPDAARVLGLVGPGVLPVTVDVQ
jgi:rare lipoprotein A